MGESCSYLGQHIILEEPAELVVGVDLLVLVHERRVQQRAGLECLVLELKADTAMTSACATARGLHSPGDTEVVRGRAKHRTHLWVVPAAEERVLVVGDMGRPHAEPRRDDDVLNLHHILPTCVATTISDLNGITTDTQAKQGTRAYHLDAELNTVLADERLELRLDFECTLEGVEASYLPM